MTDPGPLWTDVAVAVAAAAQTLVVIGALIYARGQLTEARLVREAQDRPFVIVDFDGERLDHFLFIDVSNQGRTTAHDVKFEFDPPLATTMDDLGYGVAHMTMFTEGLSMLAPGRRISALFDHAPDRKGTDLPQRHAVRVMYRGESDRKGRRRSYTDEMVLDVGTYWNRLSVTQHTVHDVHAELERIRKLLERSASLLATNRAERGRGEPRDERD